MMVVTHSQSADAGSGASVVFKNSILRGNEQRWLAITAETRDQIKYALLQLLAHEDKNRVKASSICLSAIAAIEVSRGMWDQFLQILQQNATSEPYNANIRFAAMICIKNFCDFIEDASLPQSLVQQILHCTLVNVSPQNLEITQLALTSLIRTLPSCEENFNIENQRNYIMSGILNAVQIDDEDVKTLAFQALDEVPLVGYNHLSNYLE